MKARELAEKLMKNPDGEVLFDDGISEYAYTVEVMGVFGGCTMLTFDPERGCYMIAGGKVVQV